MRCILLHMVEVVSPIFYDIKSPFLATACIALSRAAQPAHSSHRHTNNNYSSIRSAVCHSRCRCSGVRHLYDAMVDWNIDYFAIIRFKWHFFAFVLFFCCEFKCAPSVWSTQHSANDWKTWDNRLGCRYFLSLSLILLSVCCYNVAYILWRHRYCHLTSQTSVKERVNDKKRRNNKYCVRV